MRRRGSLTSTSDGRARARVRARTLCVCVLGVGTGWATGFSSSGAGIAAAATSAAKAPRAPLVRHAPPSGDQVSVSVDRGRPGATVPADFLGLSFEATVLPQLARYGERGNLVALLRSLGPGVLRLGGVSADTRIAWTDSRTPRPAWATGVVDADDLRELATLASQSGWRVVLTVGIVHFDPVAAAREVAAAKALLGPSLQAIEIGNEPNSYAMHAMRSEPWGFIQYEAEANAYRSAIEALAPGIPLAGPDVSGSSAFESWGVGEAIDLRPALLTGHHYPLGCAEIPAPSIGRLLSPRIRLKEGGSLNRYTSIARAGGIPFRLDEINSVSCGGVAGISNTFAAALWATDYLTRAISAGVVGVNLHGAPGNCKGYSPVCAPSTEALSTGALVAQPVWYAMLLAKELIGDRPLATTAIRSPAHTKVQATGLLDPAGGLDFVLVNEEPLGKRAATVRLRVGGGTTTASTMALTGPSLSALSGVSFGGSEVAPDGTWTPSRLAAAVGRHGTITVRLPAASAMLVKVAPGA